MPKNLLRNNERFPLGEFEVRASKMSQIRKDYRHPIVIALRCPRCDTLNDEIDHGKSSRCKECNLHMEVWGGGLFCR